MNALQSIFFICLFSLLPQLMNATPDQGKSLFDFWAQDDVTEVKLYLDMQQLEDDRMTENQQVARLTDSGREYGLKVEVRGRFRRRACAMPPLKLHFDKQWLNQIGFNKHNDFKLVTHCTLDEAGQDAILREQLAYELYQTIAPEASFRTQLLKVTYVDTNTDAETTSYAILIEDNDELQDRMAMDNCKDCYNFPYEQITNAEQVALFQYMIGNTDYSLIMQRNLKLLKAPTGTVTAVPYDFDFSGLVNASYAVPNSDFGQSKITQRFWKWEYKASPELAAARGQFLHQKDTLLAQVDSFTELPAKSRKEITKYLNSFFKDLKANNIAGTSVAR